MSGVRSATAQVLLLLDGQELLNGLVDGHVARRLEDVAVLDDVFLRALLHFDVKEDERVEVRGAVRGDLLVPTRRAPRAGPEAERDGLAEAVELQAADADGVHDARVVDALDGDARAVRADVHVGVGRRAKDVADDEQRDLLGLGVVEDLPRARLDHVAVSDDHRLAEERLEALRPALEDRRVVLEVDQVTAADGLEAPNGDVLLVKEANTNEIQHLHHRVCGGSQTMARCRD